MTGKSITTYFSADEAEWVKQQGKGYLRSLVQREMNKEPDVREVSEPPYTVPPWMGV